VNQEKQDGRNVLEPVYSCTEKLKARGLGAAQIGKLTQALLAIIREKDLPENIPQPVLKELSLISRFQAVHHIHFPPSQEAYEKALDRLKFEEFFVAQIRLGLIRSQRHRFSKGVVFKQVGELFNRFTLKSSPLN
jgi:ATP-dependent DNA helicase RecG